MKKNVLIMLLLGFCSAVIYANGINYKIPVNAELTQSITRAIEKSTAQAALKKLLPMTTILKPATRRSFLD